VTEVDERLFRYRCLLAVRFRDASTKRGRVHVPCPLALSCQVAGPMPLAFKFAASLTPLGIALLVFACSSEKPHDAAPDSSPLAQGASLTRRGAAKPQGIWERTMALPSRSQKILGFDPRTSELIVFGGQHFASVTAADEQWSFQEFSGWKETRAALKPSPRYGRFSMAWDAACQRGVLVGGEGSQSTLHDTWEWDGRAWTSPVTTQAPSELTEYALVYDEARRHVVAVGSWRQSVAPYATLFETWEYTGSCTGAAWERKTTSFPLQYASAWIAATHPRTGAAVVYAPGYTGTAQDFSSVYVWDGRAWKADPTLSFPANENMPSSVALAGDTTANTLFAAMVRDGGAGAAFETWEWKGRWAQLQLAPSAPVPPLGKFALFNDAKNGRVVLYRGSPSPNSYDGQDAGDVWAFRRSDARWAQLQGVAAPPEMRGDLLMGYDPKLAVSVVASSQSQLNDTWEWDGAHWALASHTTDDFAFAFSRGQTAYDRVHQQLLATIDQGTLVRSQRVWTLVPPAADDTSTFGGSTLAWDPVGQAVVRVTNDGNGNTAVFRWTGNAWTSSPVGDGPPAVRRSAILMPSPGGKMTFFGGVQDGPDQGTFPIDIWSLDAKGFRPLTTATPPARGYPEWVYDARRKCSYVFGGRALNNTNYDDVWEVCGETLRSYQPDVRPPGLSSGGAAFDEAHGRMVVYGGEGSDFGAFGDLWSFHVRGDACTSDDACDTGHCVDGVCCESVCGACEACALEGSVGVCATVRGDADPDSCSGDATCSQSGACTKKLGVTCSTSAGCDSGFCVDGVCCDSACDGQCEACNSAGTAGRCAPARGEPIAPRAGCGEASSTAVCAKPVCDGTERKACVGFPTAATACGAAECVSNAVSFVGACNGQGVCNAAPSQSCGRYVCANAACRTSCGDNADCVAPARCIKETGQCAEEARCDEKTNDAIARDGATRTACAPFRCRGGACPAACASVKDCAERYVCDGASCVSATAVTATMPTTEMPTTETTGTATTTASSSKGSCAAAARGFGASNTPAGGRLSAIVVFLAACARRRRRGSFAARR
jgi:hypothetical protein